MATNKVDDGRLVREGGLERKPCHDCVWYRAVTLQEGDCKKESNTLHLITQVWDTCEEWMSHKQLKDHLAAIEGLALQAQAEQRRRMERRPFEPDMLRVEADVAVEREHVLEGEQFQGIEPPIMHIDEDAVAEIDALAQAKFEEAATVGRVMTRVFQGEPGEETRE